MHRKKLHLLFLPGLELASELPWLCRLLEHDGARGLWRKQKEGESLGHTLTCPSLCICFPQKSGNCYLVYLLEGKDNKAVNGSSREEASNLDLICELLACTDPPQEGSVECPECQIKYSLSWREEKISS